ncbi:hypothetical protein C2845_PM01G26610 [Panicum miliaceum]|uniref:Uncharacterized protein n=3 Tax=Panicum sect. Panicum TaxID=2100772 RepID=A0A3L6TJN4_PANMI|nr:hypothetical protein C2845_PM01G26610 [Panicum miliaceum]
MGSRGAERRWAEGRRRDAGHRRGHGRRGSLGHRGGQVPLGPVHVPGAQARLRPRRRGRFREGGDEHEVAVHACRGGDGLLRVSIDGEKVAEVRRVGWGFRGNRAAVLADGEVVNIMWGVHDWWKAPHSQMKHIFKIVAILVAISAIWVALLETSTVPRSYTWLLPIYLVVALGCYGLFMVGFGLMFFPTCPQEAILLQQDIVEAKEFLAKKGVDVGSE